MKKLALFCSLLLIVAASAGAHEGAISLYADTGLNSCSMEIPIGNTGAIWVLYVRDEGIDMGAAAEFRIYCTNPAIMFFTPTWESYIDIPPMGAPPGDISIAGSTKFGCGLDIVPLGQLTLLNTGDVDTFMVKLVENAGSYPVPAVKITACDEDNTEVSVLGGIFALTGDQVNFPANCNPAVESKTWGAIKSMYK